jgi:hypothetical protein
MLVMDRDKSCYNPKGITVSPTPRKASIQSWVCSHDVVCLPFQLFLSLSVLLLLRDFVDNLHVIMDSLLSFVGKRVLLVLS